MTRRKTTRILAILCACIMMLAMVVPYAMAMEVTHEIIETPGENQAPFSMSAGDNIEFEILAEFSENAEKPDEIDIDVNDCMLFVDVDEISVYDNAGNELYWTGIEETTKENETVKLYLSAIPTEAVSLKLTYTCCAKDILSAGVKGMYNTAHIITHVNNVRQNESSSVDVESRRVYTWYMELWTIDTRKDRQISTTSSGATNKGTQTGVDMHPGQAVSGASFKIYTDADLTKPLSFLPEFRTYRVCSDAMAKHVDEITMDNGGRALITGLKSGEYWIQETEPACGYDPAIKKPIRVEFAYDESELPEVKLINHFDNATDNNFRIETRRGPQILIDYRNVYDKTVIAHYAAITLTGVCGGLLALALAYYTHKRKKKL